MIFQIPTSIVKFAESQAHHPGGRVGEYLLACGALGVLLAIIVVFIFIVQGMMWVCFRRRRNGLVFWEWHMDWVWPVVILLMFDICLIFSILAVNWVVTLVSR